MFIFQMGVIVWLMGYLMIWFVFRSEKVWPAIVPGGLVLLINLYYAPKDITFWFILYMLVSLLLVIRFNLFGQEKVWRSEGTFFRPDISFDFLRDGFIFSALVIAFAWLTPPLVDVKTLGLFDEFQGSWRDVQNEWNRMFADLNYRDRVAFDTFGASLKLGGPRRLTDDAMKIKPTSDQTSRYRCPALRPVKPLPKPLPFTAITRRFCMPCPARSTWIARPELHLMLYPIRKSSTAAYRPGRTADSHGRKKLPMFAVMPR
jgi:hypothetical protein